MKESFSIDPFRSDDSLMAFSTSTQRNLLSVLVGGTVFTAGLLHGCPSPIRKVTDTVTPNCTNFRYYESQRNELIGIFDLRESITQGSECNELWMYTPSKQLWTEFGRAPWYGSSFEDGSSPFQVGILESHLNRDDDLKIYAIRAKTSSSHDNVSSFLLNYEELSYARALGQRFYHRHSNRNFSFNLISSTGITTLDLPFSFYDSSSYSQLETLTQCHDRALQYALDFLTESQIVYPNRPVSLGKSVFGCGDAKMTYVPYAQTTEL